MTQRLGYVRALDGVRGLAIAGVTGAHFFRLPGGNFGVDVFFVLSGFLITTLLLEEHAAKGRIDLRGFYLRRARRLLPALGGLLAAFAALGSLVYTQDRVIEILAAGGLYIANVVRAVAPSVLTATPLDHMWSLAMEEQFYLVWPAVLILLLGRGIGARRMVRALAVLFVALVVYRLTLVTLGASQHRVYFAPDTHGADGLIAGCLLAFARQFGIALPRWAGLAALCSIVVGFCVIGSWRFNAVVELPAIEIASAVMILGAATAGPTSRLLSLRPIVWLGTISYTLYLWQQLPRWLIAGPHPWPELAITVLLTLFSFYVLEKPFRRHRTAEPTKPATVALAES